MPFPTQSKVALWIQLELDEAGGAMPLQDLYDKYLERFDLTTADRIEIHLPSGEPKWQNQLRQARRQLVDDGLVYSEPEGMWRLSGKGRRELREFVELVDDLSDLILWREDWRGNR